MTRILVAGSKTLLSPAGHVLLNAKGYNVKVCTTLNTTLAQVFDDPPDMLLLEKNFTGSLSGDAELIRSVKACLQKANIPILLVVPTEELGVDMDWNAYPVDDIIEAPFAVEILLVRIRLAESRMLRVFDNNPLSKLPGNTSILGAIQRALDRKEGYGVCYVDIDNFKPYNDRYGFSRGDEIILMVARIIINVVDELAREDSFVGHVGGDDYVFIVREENVTKVCDKILDNFNLVRNMFLSAEDIAAGEFVGRDRMDRETRFGLLSLSIAVVTTGGNKYHHYGEVSAVASQLKHCVKKLEGSNFLVDRRN
ncbi:MAG: diguanylate cyclase [Desulfobulbaceae bacterium]|nr:diguanylate cyclase [Desulfobulbaceae bacterium]HIJ79190.1 diguanylate cyclase [Deltaproteobacteria bacterium]